MNQTKKRRRTRKKRIWKMMMLKRTKMTSKTMTRKSTPYWTEILTTRNPRVMKKNLNLKRTSQRSKMKKNPNPKTSLKMMKVRQRN